MENAHAIGDWRPLVTERSVTYKRSSTTGKFVQHSFKGEPAVVRGNGDKEFWKNGKRHNDNGPAVRKGDGTEEYYLDDEKLTKTKWNNRKNKPIELDKLLNNFKMGNGCSGKSQSRGGIEEL